MSESNKRVFNEEEVGRLLQLAIKRQEADSEAQYSLNHGLTIEEVQRIATEAGIDEKYIQFALLNLDKIAAEKTKPGFWGSPSDIVLEREVPGQLNESVFVEMLAEIRRTFRSSPGIFETLENNFGWSNINSGGSISIFAQPHGDSVRITIKEKMDSYLVLTHLWAFILLFLGSILSLLKLSPFLFLTFISIFASLFFMARWGMWRINRNRTKKLSEFLDNIGQIIEKKNEANWHYGDKTVSSSKPLIDLDQTAGYDSETTGNKSSKKTKS